MEQKKWDFKGWATRHNVRCGDGRIIKEGAFKHNDKQTVPLVWNHDHKDASNVLGHALLSYNKDGVYAFGKFNNTDQGQNAKELVRNGDITALSIYANKLEQKNNEVLHGNIREVSLVLAGANPGAYIEDVLFHGDGENDGESKGVIIWNNSEIELVHSEDNSGDQEKKSEEMKHSDNENKEKENNKMNKEKTIQEVYDTLNEEQKLMVTALVGAALEDADEDDKYDEDEGDNEMKQNAFDNQGTNQDDVLTHAEFTEILNDAKRNGSLKDAFLAHGIDSIAHSITDIDKLFPEVKNLTATPEIISRDMEWVSAVMNGVSKSPFARVKSTAVNLTADEARAKGYVKGERKVEEVITALKRTTTPTTVYKLQKLDRDDVIDITDFDVIAFMKSEMRVMLNEEIARAILIGDGRLNSSADKINPINIRPIYGDDPVYTIVRTLTPAAGDSAAKKAKALIQDIIRARKLYKGSGNPSFFTTEDQLVEMLLLEDTNGRVIYDTVDKLKTALRVKDVITVSPMEGINRVSGSDQYDLLGILVNLTDYAVGADKGGDVAMFDDFDLNLNKYEYLIETRCSGALKKPYSAIVFESKGAIVEG